MAGGHGRPGVRMRPWTGEPVVRVGPGRGLLRVESGGTDPVGKLGEMVPAALAHGSERHPVPGELQGDLIRLPLPVPARYRDDAEDRIINAEYLPHN